MKPETNRWLVLVLVCVAQFMVVLDATIVNVALPSIQQGSTSRRRACSGSSTPTRSSSAASCCSAGAPPTCFGRQRLFMAGLAVFTGASLLNGVAAVVRRC